MAGNHAATRIATASRNASPPSWRWRALALARCLAVWFGQTVGLAHSAVRSAYRAAAAYWPACCSYRRSGRHAAPPSCTPVDACCARRIASRSSAIGNGARMAPARQVRRRSTSTPTTPRSCSAIDAETMAAAGGDYWDLIAHPDDRDLARSRYLQFLRDDDAGACSGVPHPCIRSSASVTSANAPRRCFDAKGRLSRHRRHAAGRHRRAAAPSNRLARRRSQAAPRLPHGQARALELRAQPRAPGRRAPASTPIRTR